jgi:hypothetical protein
VRGPRQRTTSGIRVREATTGRWWRAGKAGKGDGRPATAGGGAGSQPWRRRRVAAVAHRRRKAAAGGSGSRV